MKKIGTEKKKETIKSFTTKSFQKLMEKRLTKSEIAEIEHQAMLEARTLARAASGI